MNGKPTVLWMALHGTAILVSILIAFSLEAWWSERQEVEEQDRLLHALQIETGANLDAIDSNKRYRVAVMEVCNQILAAKPESISSERFDTLLADLLWWLKPDFVRGAITSFVDGGKLVLIDNPELSLLISEVSNDLERVNEIAQRDFERMHDHVLPFLYRHGSLPQISNIASKGPPGGGSWPPSPVVFDEGGRDHRVLLTEDEFRGLVLIKQWDQADVISALERLESTMKKLLAILNER